MMNVVIALLVVKTAALIAVLAIHWRTAATILGIGGRRCAWCKRWLGVKWMGWNNGGETSHGICGRCAEKWERGEEIP